MSTNLDRSTAGAQARLGTAWHTGEKLTPIADVRELSDEQRAGVLAFFAATPDGGYKAALRAVGIRATLPEARALLHADEEMREARFKSMYLDEGSLFKQLGTIASDGDHKDQFRAVTWALNAIHRWHENASIEHTGRPMGVTVEHDFSGILDGLESIGVLRRGTPALDAADLPVLPARTDEAAGDSAGGASLPPE